VAGNPARYQELFVGWEVGNGFGSGLCARPGPGGEFVHDVVPGGYEFLGSYLACGTEGGGVGDGGEAVAEGVEGGVY